VLIALVAVLLDRFVDDVFQRWRDITIEANQWGCTLLLYRVLSAAPCPARNDLYAHQRISRYPAPEFITPC
jgi:hypothetical protein